MPSFSNVGVQLENGHFLSRFSFMQGRPDWVGPWIKNYKTTESVNELIENQYFLEEYNSADLFHPNYFLIFKIGSIIVLTSIPITTIIFL